MRKIAILDFLKGFSIFTIVVFHCLQRINLPEILKNAILFGGTGVHLFIVLSGFGLYYSYLYKPISFYNFIKKRLSKIYIPYIILILYIPYIILVLLSAIIALYIPIYKNSLYALGGHVFLYKMFDNNIIGSYGFQLWFISTIIQFYLSFYIILRIKKNTTPGVFLVFGLLVSLSWSLFVILSGKTELRSWNSFFLQYLWEFVLGILLAERVANNTISTVANKFYYLGISIFFIGLYGILALKGGTIGKMLNDIPALIGYSLLAIFIYNLRIKFLNNFFNFVGTISYPLYLSHVLVLFIVKYVVESFGKSYDFGSLIATLALSFLLSYLYTKYSNSLKKSLTNVSFSK